MQPDACRQFLGLVKVKSAYYLLRVPAQFFPSVAFRHNRIGQAFCAEAPIRFLDNFKNKLRHDEDRTQRLNEVKLWDWADFNKVSTRWYHAKYLAVT